MSLNTFWTGFLSGLVGGMAFRICSMIKNKIYKKSNEWLKMKWTKCVNEEPPKDGNPFLGYGPDTLNEETECVTMVWHFGGIDSDGYEMNEGFYALGEWGEYNREHACNPTHWMDLPEEPEE